MKRGPMSTVTRLSDAHVRLLLDVTRGHVLHDGSAGP